MEPIDQLKVIDQKAVDLTLHMLKFSQANISNHKVGACVVASNLKGDYGYFGGCNIELATSKVWHAEEVALAKAISAGYRHIFACYVTSNNFDQTAACCGYCMQHLMYANPKAIIFVVHPDGSPKLAVSVEERNGQYAYLGKGRLDP